jgi:hypothetical protein
MASNIIDKNTPLTNQKHKCEMCGNEALPLHTLCKAHLDVRTAEQLKGREYVSMPVSSSPVN